MFVFSTLAYSLEQFLHGHEDDTRLLYGARDCMSLSAARCTVRKHCCIITVEYIIQQWSCRSLIHLALCYVLIKYPVEAEGLVLDSLSGWASNRSGEFLYRIVFGRIKNSVIS